MKRSILFILFACTALFVLTAAAAFAQDKIQITVKDTTVNNGVILVNVHESGKALELQCNESAPHCAAPRAGTYWMVRLPKNHGLYDCVNVDLYTQSETEGQETVIGEYCINEK